MPVIPDFTAADTPAAPRLSPDAAGSPLASVARGMESIGVTLEDFNAKYQQARRQAEASDNVTGLTRDLGELEQKWSMTPDRLAAGAGFDKEAAALKKTRLEAIQDPLVRQHVGQQFDSQAVTRGLSTQASAFRLESSKRAGELNVNLLAMAEEASKATSDATRTQIIDNAAASIKSAVGAGWISPETGQNASDQFANDVAKLGARQLINTNPAQAIKALQNHDNFPHLQPDTRQTLLEQAQDEQKRRDAEARSRANEAKVVAQHEQNELFKDELASVATTGKRLNLVSKESLQVFGADTAEKMLGALESTQRTKIAENDLALQTPAEVQATVDRAKPATGTVPSAAIEKDLNLNTQEKNLYQHHLTNLETDKYVRNDDGSYSSVLQTSQEHGGRFYNIPTVWDGKAHTEDEAVAHADATGWDKWPSYASRDEAENRYQQMHAYMEQDTPENVKAATTGEGYAAGIEDFNTLANTANKLLEEKQKDPAAYALNHSDAVRSKWTAADADQASPDKAQEAISLSLNTQRHVGVREVDLRIFSKEQAQSIVTDIAGSKAEDAADKMQGLAEVYGPYWEQAFGELVKANLDPSYIVLATTEDPRARVVLAQQLAQGDKTKKMLGESATKEVNDYVDSAMAMFASTAQNMPNSATVVSQYRDAARLYAYALALNGDTSGAATTAVKAILDNKYDYAQDRSYLGSFNARAPKTDGEHDKRRAMVTASFKAMSLTTADIPDPGGGGDAALTAMLPEQRKEEYLKRIRRGTWVTNEHDDGWYLLNTNGEPVILANGQRLEFLYKDMMEVGRGSYGRDVPAGYDFEEPIGGGSYGGRYVKQ